MGARRGLGLVCVCVMACGGGGNPTTDGGPGGDDGGTTPPGDGGVTPPGDAAVPPPPPATCADPVPLADTSKPTTVVGTGTPQSCTEQALAAALATGGVVTFDCGPSPATITVTSELVVKKDTTIDGKDKVTLSGGKKTRILHLASAWNLATPKLTVQNLAFVDGYTTDVPNTKSTKMGGAAIFEDGGSLTVIHCTFTGNQCASTGQDVSGGAINGQGVGKLVVEDSVFANNSGSNGGAIGTQAEDVVVVNSTFSNNAATGTGGNPGNGGDGGGLTYDGANNALTLCGDVFTGNKANAAGGAVFRVAYKDEPVTIDRCTFDANEVDMNSGNAAGLYLENVTIDMTATTISNNKGHYGGGIWIGQSAVAHLTNVTIANNFASGGGGVWFANGVTGTFLNVTVAGNTGDGLFGGDTGVALQNCVIANNVRGTLDGTTNCAKGHASGGPNLQFPAAGTACAPGVTNADPLLGALGDNGGPTKTMAPAMGSPAIGKGTNCPPYDQRGTKRAAACTLGAVE